MWHFSSSSLLQYVSGTIGDEMPLLTFFTSAVPLYVIKQIKTLYILKVAVNVLIDTAVDWGYCAMLYPSMQYATDNVCGDFLT